MLAWWLCQCGTGACQYHWCSIYRGLAPGCLVAQSVGISWLWRLKSDATGSIPADWVRGVTWVPIFLYSTILTSLRKENHLETLQMRENCLENIVVVVVVVVIVV